MMDTANQYVHEAVLLREVLELLPTDPNGVYVDGTFGRGGHTRALLGQLGPEARVFGIDRDPQAVAVGQQLEKEDARFKMIASRFDCLPRVVEQAGEKLSGILLDLGVSSPQLDDAERGFSFLRDGPLDMRMDPNSGESAAEWLAHAAEEDIANVLYRYGEERKSRWIAKRIVETRSAAPLTRTSELAALITNVLGRGTPGKHPATRSFQAIRIHVNQELAALENVLEQSLETLQPGGRLAVISFHSLEDRMVKLFMRDAAGRAPQPRNMPYVEQKQYVELIGRAIKAKKEEVANNVRARSAVLRVAERIAA